MAVPMGNQVLIAKSSTTRIAVAAPWASAALAAIPLPSMSMPTKVTSVVTRITAVTANAATLGISERDMRARREEQVPARRIGTPEEFGEACAFLCSAQAGYITGQNLLVDGGLYTSAF